MTEPSSFPQPSEYNSDLRPPKIGVALLLLIALAVIVGGGFALYNSLRTTAVSTSPEEQKARAYIADLTRDPAAVQFRNIIIDKRCVIGEVNGKNAYGAYTGYHRFFYSLKEGSGNIEEIQNLPALDNSDEALNGLSEHADFVLQLSQCQLGKPIRS